MRFTPLDVGRLFDLDPLEVLMVPLLEPLRSMVRNEFFNRPTAKSLSAETQKIGASGLLTWAGIKPFTVVARALVNAATHEPAEMRKHLVG